MVVPLYVQSLAFRRSGANAVLVPQSLEWRAAFPIDMTLSCKDIAPLSVGFYDLGTEALL